MEPGNLHPQHQLQEQFTGVNYSSSSPYQPEYYKISSPSDLTPGTFLNITGGTYNSHLTECMQNSREPWPPIGASISPGLSYGNGTSFTHQFACDLLLAKIKDEMLDSFPKRSEMIHSPSNVEESHSLSTKGKQRYSHDVSRETNWLSNLSSVDRITQLPVSGGELYSNTQNSTSDLESPCASSRCNNFGRVLPSINISTSDLCFSLVSSSMNLNLQAADLLTSAYEYDGASSSQSSQNSTLGHHFLQELKDSPSNSSNKTLAFEDGVRRRKRPSNFCQSKNTVTDTKKQRSTPRPSCQPMKVRKEKLGDRIAALQRLVAPYGKTDTASVLTEAIGYIHFLHDQLQILSVPYLKSLNCKPTRTTQASSSEEPRMGQAKRDLTSRGLCLMPLSCASYFNGCDSGI